MKNPIHLPHLHRKKKVNIAVLLIAGGAAVLLFAVILALAPWTQPAPAGPTAAGELRALNQRVDLLLEVLDKIQRRIGD